MKRRTPAWQRAWNIWLALPEVARMGVLLIAMVALAFMSGNGI